MVYYWTMTNNTSTSTLAEHLEAAGIDPTQVDFGLWSVLDLEVASFACCATSGTAALQGHCNGLCLFSVRWSNKLRRPGYIVVRDDRGEQWDADKAAGRPLSQHYRPHAYLAFAQSA